MYHRERVKTAKPKIAHPSSTSSSLDTITPGKQSRVKSREKSATRSVSRASVRSTTPAFESIEAAFMSPGGLPNRKAVTEQNSTASHEKRGYLDYINTAPGVKTLSNPSKEHESNLSRSVGCTLYTPNVSNTCMLSRLTKLSLSAEPLETNTEHTDHSLHPPTAATGVLDSSGLFEINGHKLNQEAVNDMFTYMSPKIDVPLRQNSWKSSAKLDHHNPKPAIHQVTPIHDGSAGAPTSEGLDSAADDFSPHKGHAPAQKDRFTSQSNEDNTSSAAEAGLESFVRKLAKDIEAPENDSEDISKVRNGIENQIRILQHRDFHLEEPLRKLLKHAMKDTESSVPLSLAPRSEEVHEFYDSFLEADDSSETPAQRTALIKVLYKYALLEASVRRSHETITRMQQTFIEENGVGDEQSYSRLRQELAAVYDMYLDRFGTPEGYY